MVRNRDVPEYCGAYHEHRLSLEQAREKVRAAVLRLFAVDALLLTLDVSEECIVHKFANHLEAKFDDLHVDVEYNGWRDKHPKLLIDIERWVKEAKVERKEVYPDVIVHWRRHPVNVLVVEVKKSTNTLKSRRDLDRKKLKAFTSSTLPVEPFNYHVGLFLEVSTGRQVRGELKARAIWFIDGEESPTEELASMPYTGP